MLATLQPVHLNLVLYSEDRLFEREIDGLAQIRPALSLPRAMAGRIAEEGIEYISEPTKYVEAVERAVEPSVGGYTSVAEPIVLRPLLGVRQDLVGFVDFFKFIFRVGVLVAVRMVL
jgi:hypothetical protein